MRHAKAAPDAPGGDAARPLAERGRKAAKSMGAYLARLRPRPDLILCSPATRTRETLELVRPALHPKPEALYEETLYLADAKTLLERLRRLPEETLCVLLIGHNPGMHELAARLAADPGPLAGGFPTGALAILESSGGWAALHWRGAKLRGFQKPKELNRELGPDAG